VSDFGRRIRAHKTSHQDGGIDEISVEGLAGDLAEDQAATAHGMGGTKHIASLLALVNSKISDANLDDKTDSRTPLAHKTSHQSGGADALACSGLVGRVNLVNRGDPANWDKNVGDLTTNGAWQDLDLNLLVPAGAIAIVLRCTIAAALVNAILTLRKNGNAQEKNINAMRTTVADIEESAQHVVFCDAGRVIEYKASDTAWTQLSMLVAGWYI